jgi:ABC-2 type transport system permease protein
VSRRALALVVDPMRSTWRGVVAWVVSIGSLVAVTVAFWPAFREATDLGSLLGQMIDQIPPDMVKAFGMAGFDTPAGYLRGNLYAILVPLLFGGAAIGLANGLTAAEEDSGRLELVLAQPASRGAAFSGRAAAMLAWMGVIVAGVAVFQVASDIVFDLQVASDRLLATVVLCGLLGVLHGCLALAVAGFLPRPSAVLGIPLVVLVAGFVVAALFPLSDPLRDWARLSPWDWALGGDPLVGGADAWRYVALAVPSAILFVVGLAGFTHRDVRSA